jgi:hypothetical protein
VVGEDPDFAVGSAEAGDDRRDHGDGDEAGDGRDR